MITFIQLIMSIATLVVSISAIVLSVKISKDSQRITLVAQKRSERIDDLRLYSSAILSSAESIIRRVDESNSNKSELIRNVCLFVSQLQYIYPYDIQLIDEALQIKETVLSLSCDTDCVLKMLNKFWKDVDLYVGTEYERLKKESIGEMEETGAIEESTMTFEQIYESLEVASKQYSSEFKKNHKI